MSRNSNNLGADTPQHRPMMQTPQSSGFRRFSTPALQKCQKLASPLVVPVHEWPIPYEWLPEAMNAGEGFSSMPFCPQS